MNVYFKKNIIKNSYMKKLFLAILIITIANSGMVYADTDLWDNFGDQNYYGNKPVSDADFDKALASKKREKKPKKMKGDAYQQSNETEVITQVSEEFPVVCITADLKIDEDNILPVGHYQIKSEKINNKIYLKLYQGHYLMAELEAIETLEDFDEPEINFANCITDGNIYKIIYGSVDYNAYINLEPVQ